MAALDIVPPTYDLPADADDDLVRLDVRGLGRHRLAWGLHPANPRTGLRPSSRIMQVVLDAPAGTAAFSGTLNAEAVVCHKPLGHMTTSTATTQSPVRFTLGTDGRFELQPRAGRR